MEELIARQRQQEALAAAARYRQLPPESRHPLQARLALGLRALADRVEPRESPRPEWAI